MTDWTYHVKVSTEAGSSVTSAVAQLETAQQEARNQFNNITNFFQSDQFSKNLLGALDERLKDFGKEETEESIIPILQSLMEIKAGVLMLIDVKEGNIDNLMESFKRMGEHIGEGGIQTGLEDLLRMDIEKAEARQERDIQVTRLLAAFNTLIPQFNKREENILVPDETGKVEYYNRLPNVRNIGDEEETMQKHIRSLAESGAKEFYKTIIGTGGKESGIEKFRDYLIGGERNPAYEKVTDIFRGMAETRREHALYDVPEGLADRPQEANAAIKAHNEAYTKNMANFMVQLTNPELFDDLQNEFKKGLTNALSTTSIWRKEENKELFDLLLDDFFTNVKNDAIQQNFDSESFDSVGLGNPMAPFLESVEKMFNIDALVANIDTILANKDFLKLNTLKEKLQELMTTAHDEGFDEKSGTPATDIIEKLRQLMLGTNDYSEIVAKALVEVLQKVLDKNEQAIEAEIFKAHSGRAPTLDAIIDTPEQRDSKVNESLLKLIEIMKKTSMSTSSDTTKSLSYDKFFEDAQTDREDRFGLVIQSVGLAADYIVNEIFNTEISISQKTHAIQETLDQIKDTPSKQGTAASSSDFYPAL